MLFLGRHHQRANPRRPERRVGIFEVFQDHGLLVAVSLDDRLDLIDQGADGSTLGQAIVVEVESGHVVIAQGVESAAGQCQPPPALEVDGDVVVTVASGPIKELNLELLVLAVAMDPGADRFAAGQVERAAPAFALNAPAAGPTVRGRGEPGGESFCFCLLGASEIVRAARPIGPVGQGRRRVRIHVQLGSQYRGCPAVRGSRVQGGPQTGLSGHVETKEQEPLHRPSRRE